MPDTEIVKDLRRSLLWLRVTTAVLCVFSVAVIVGAVLVYRDAHKTHAALCAFQNELEIRVANGRQFLKDNPKGIPGLSRAVILNGIKGQQRTIRSLHGLNCPPGI